MLKQVLIGLVMPVLLALPAIGVADVITFEDRVIDPLDFAAGAQTEGAFQYQATVGEGWEVQNSIGNLVSALATTFNGESASVGEIVDIKLTGGGLFSFVSVDFRTIFDSNGDRVSITGFVGGNPTADTLNLITSTQTFQTVGSGFLSPIDLLRVKVNFVGGGALILDNFTFAVPEPSTLALVLLGAFFAFQRRKSRNSG